MEEKKKSRKGLIIGLIITAAIILIGGGVAAIFVFMNRGSQMPDEMVDMGYMTCRLEKQDLSTSISCSGKVESAGVIEVTSDAASPIVELNVALGDRVEEGDVLCVFDDEAIKQQIADLEKQQAMSNQEKTRMVNQAQRDLDTAKGQLATANEAVAKAQAVYDAAVAEGKTSEELESYLSLLMEAQSTQAAAQQTVDACQGALDNANATQVESVASELNKLRKQLDNLTVVAEQGGIITSLNVAKGSVPSGPLMRIEDDTNLKVNVSIRERDILKIKEGMKVNISSDILEDGKAYSGKVEKVINFASAGNSMESTGGGYSATIVMDGDAPFLLGMSVKVEILMNEVGQQLAVPYDAIGYTEEGQAYVYRCVEQENGMYLVEKIDVTVGDSNEYFTVIEAKELAEGDLLINYPYEVTEGQEIQVYIPDQEEIIFEEN